MKKMRTLNVEKGFGDPATHIKIRKAATDLLMYFIGMEEHYPLWTLLSRMQVES